MTPIPVTLDGHTHEANFSMEDIVLHIRHHSQRRHDLKLQMVPRPRHIVNCTQFGFINVSDVHVSLPTPGPLAVVQPELLTKKSPCNRSLEPANHQLDPSVSVDQL